MQSNFENTKLKAKGTSIVSKSFKFSKFICKMTFYLITYFILQIMGKMAQDYANNKMVNFSASGFHD